jgi:ring-1,2-phenylacetyl-CoA epoxidase subunit PaaC
MTDETRHQDATHQNAAWLIRLGDTSLVLGHRLSEWSSRGPTLEEDIALSNLALDLIGQTRALYGHACCLERGSRDEDMLAYRRVEQEFRNPLLVEQPNGNFADTMVRHLIFSAHALPLFEALRQSNDDEVAGIATRSARELTYHVRHASEWVIRLGDGTPESQTKTSTALAELWPYVPELFEADDLDRQVAARGFGVDPSMLRAAFDATVDPVLERATLKRPREVYGQRGGKQGRHSEHLGPMLAMMQNLQRAYPDAVW